MVSAILFTFFFIDWYPVRTGSLTMGVSVTQVQNLSHRADRVPVNEEGKQYSGCTKFPFKYISDCKSWSDC